MTEKETARDPHTLITKEILEATLEQDLGSNWRLAHYEIKDFTKKGDNYACAVTGVSCEAEFNDTKKTAKYVAKLNPLRDMTMMNDMLHEMFIREGTFFTEVAIILNRILKDINYPSINFPQCLYHDFRKGQEILLSRDLRLKGFKMFDKKVGMGFDHAILVIKELAKLHASSAIFKKELKNEDVLNSYPFMYDKWIDPQTESRQMFQSVFNNAIDCSLRLTDKLTEYEIQKKWLKDMRNRSMDAYADQIKSSPARMKVICHGDCWNNNILFRYSDSEHPEEVALVDLQLCRFASLGLDLNYFFYTSLTGEVRKEYYDQLLSVYLKEFGHVMKAANMEIPFTEEDVRKEVFDKTLFGILSGMMIMPAIALESEDIPDMEDIKDNDLEGFIKDNQDNFFKIMENNLVFKTRFLSLLDDLLDKLLSNRTC